MKNNRDHYENEQPEEQTWADTFLALSLIFVSIVSGVVLGVYWRVLVLDNFIEMETAAISDYLLLILYAPVGIIGVIIGFIWFYLAYKFFKIVGIRTKTVNFQ